MATINLPTTSNPLSTISTFTEETTSQQSLSPTSEDLVAKAIAIVKRTAESRNFDQIDEPLKQLKASCKSTQEEMRFFSAFVLQIKNTGTTADLPIIYQHVLEDFQVDNPLFINDFSNSPEAFRIACAKRQAKKNPSNLCSNIKEYDIRDQAALVEIIKIAVEVFRIKSKEDRTSFKFISLFIADFGIESEEARIEIAKVVAQYETGFSESLCNYKITKEDALKEIVDLILQKENSIDVFRRLAWQFGFKDDHKLKTVNRILSNPAHLKKNLKYICNNFQRFSVEDQGQHIQWAKLAAKNIPHNLAQHIAEFEIENQEALLEIALLAIDKAGSLMHLDSIRNFGLNLQNRAILFSHFIQMCPERADEISHFFPEKREAIQLFPELLLLDVEGNLAEEIRMLALRTAVFDYAKGSTQLSTQLTLILDKIEHMTAHEKEKSMTWMAGLILRCRTLKVTDSAFLRNLSLFEALLGIKEPQVRTLLAPYFIDTLLHPRFESILGKEKINKKNLATRFARMMTASIVSQIEPYMDGVEFSSNADGTVKGKRRLESFAHRMQELLTNDFFKNGVQMNSFLKSLNSLIQTKKLTSRQKGTVLRDLIFAKEETLLVKQQSERLARSCDLVAQFINIDPLKLLDISDPQELQTELPKLFSSALNVEVDDFLNKFLSTFALSRKPEALMVYAKTLESLPSIQKEKLFPLLKNYTESVLNGTFADFRYSLEKNFSGHLKKLLDTAPDLLQEWKKGAQFAQGSYKVVDTDNPYDLLLCGTEVGSCQGVNKNPAFSKCLVAYLLDPKIRLMAVKNEKGQIVARCVLRLLWDENNKRFGLFQEKLYPLQCEKRFADMINASCIERSKQLNIPLLKMDPLEIGRVTLTSFPGRAPFEYVDALLGVKKSDKGYQIDRCSYVYQPTS